MQGSWGERGGVRVSPLADGCGIGAAYRRVSRPPQLSLKAGGKYCHSLSCPASPHVP